MYIFEHKFAVEIEEKGHTDRNQEKENERQIKTENHSDCKFFRRINAGAEGFDSFVEISKICNYISQSNKEKNKRARKQNKRTRKQNKRKERVFKRIINSCVQYFYASKTHQIFFKKNTCRIAKQEKHAIKNKTDKNWKKSWNNVLFWVQILYT